MKDTQTKSPRLYVFDNVSKGTDICLSSDQSHYLANVMRMNEGQSIRVFNGRDGEYNACIKSISKKQVTVEIGESIRDHKAAAYSVHLYCPLIKKDRFAFMIEKAVELGVTHIYPFTSDRTQLSKMNFDKVEKQIIEAAEQCERLTLPKLNDVKTLSALSFNHPTYCAMERKDNKIFKPNRIDDIGIIIGPEGGWGDNDIDFLNGATNIAPTSLGDNILRAETAALFMLSRIEK
jgi:16S rRNA (uracil1498-N3)-methyltransferase